MSKKILFPILFLLLFPSLKICAQDYDIFVDINNNSGTQDGSESHPFNSITQAIELAKDNAIENRKIYVKNGEYLENIILEEGMEIYGENTNDTIINGTGAGTTVTMRDKTALINIKIYKGNKGISIEKNSKITIDTVTIQKTSKIGINIEESSKKRIVTIKNSEISENDGKGIYVKKDNNAKIYNNKIHNNTEEGIDIRSNAKGSIKNNKIYENGEGGIELIIEKSKMNIDKNKIYKNSASGIAFQAYTGGSSSKGSNKATKNRISSNKQYGIECNIPSKLEKSGPILWSKSVTIKGNTLSDNKLGIFSNNCLFGTY